MVGGDLEEDWWRIGGGFGKEGEEARGRGLFLVGGSR